MAERERVAKTALLETLLLGMSDEALHAGLVGGQIARTAMQKARPDTRRTRGAAIAKLQKLTAEQLQAVLATMEKMES